MGVTSGAPERNRYMMPLDAFSDAIKELGSGKLIARGIDKEIHTIWYLYGIAGEGRTLFYTIEVPMFGETAPTINEVTSDVGALLDDAMIRDSESTHVKDAYTAMREAFEMLGGEGGDDREWVDEMPDEDEDQLESGV